jgi:hypothetical protein
MNLKGQRRKHLSKHSLSKLKSKATILLRNKTATFFYVLANSLNPTTSNLPTPSSLPQLNTMTLSS